jgi:hypothetical protein
VTTKHFPLSDAMLHFAMNMPGVMKSGLVWVANKCKMHQPFSAGFLQHYLEGSGKPLDVSDVGPIPEQWQEWIAKKTKGVPGRHHLDPYHSVPLITDMKNSLGHFDVIVSQSPDSSKKIYEIEKREYHFGFKPHDKGHTGQHGFELQHWSEHEVKEAQYFLPVEKFHNPGGFSEKFEIRKDHQHHWVLFVPQQVAAQAGKPFAVHGRFER